MDSVTQFALGATVSAAVLGPRIGIRNAVILGGIYGTLPDLDSFLPAETPVDAFVSHRGATHSLILQAIAAPLLAEPLVRMFSALREHRLRTYAAVYLIFVTHALIDAITIYGTRLFMPLYDGPIGIGSVFIIDPIYTLPLLIMTLAGLFFGAWRARYGTWLRRALIFTTLYMVLSIPVQGFMNQRALETLQANGVNATADNTLTISGPFSLLYWKTVTVEQDRYVNLYQPLFGNGAHAYAHPRRGDLIASLQELKSFRDLAGFAKGTYSLDVRDDAIVYSDLRMGLTPAYAFRFTIARLDDEQLIQPVEPVRFETDRKQDGDLDWLLAGIRQSPIVRPIEQDRLLFATTD